MKAGLGARLRRLEAEVEALRPPPPFEPPALFWAADDGAYEPGITRNRDGSLDIRLGWTDGPGVHYERPPDPAEVAEGADEGEAGYGSLLHPERSGEEKEAPRRRGEDEAPEPQVFYRTIHTTKGVGVEVDEIDLWG